MNHEKILRVMLAQREFVVDLAEGRRVTVRRPTEMQIQRDHVVLKFNPDTPDKRDASLTVDPDKVHELCVGWEGFSEADLTGAAGSSDAVPFHAELLRLWLEDQPDQARTLCTAVLDQMVAHLNRRSTAEKN